VDSTCTFTSCARRFGRRGHSEIAPARRAPRAAQAVEGRDGMLRARRSPSYGVLKLTPWHICVADLLQPQNIRVWRDDR
jgi:hypothetical protein